MFADKLARGADERVAFAYLAVATFLGFLAQLPVLVRRARTPDPEFDAAIVAEAGQGRVLAVPEQLADAKFEALVAGAMMGWLFIVPLALYGLALLSHWVARLFGGRGTPLGARLALFWAALAASPGLLLLGLTQGFVGDGIEAAIVFAATMSAFLWIWLNDLYVAEWRHP